MPNVRLALARLLAGVAHLAQSQNQAAHDDALAGPGTPPAVGAPGIWVAARVGSGGSDEVGNLAPQKTLEGGLPGGGCGCCAAPPPAQRQACSAASSRQGSEGCAGGGDGLVDLLESSAVCCSAASAPGQRQAREPGARSDQGSQPAVQAGGGSAVADGSGAPRVGGPLLETGRGSRAAELMGDVAAALGRLADDGDRDVGDAAAAGLSRLVRACHLANNTSTDQEPGRGENRDVADARAGALSCLVRACHLGLQATTHQQLAHAEDHVVAHATGNGSLGCPACARRFGDGTDQQPAKVAGERHGGGGLSYLGRARCRNLGA